MHRLPLLLRLFMFAFGCACIGLLWWSNTSDPNHWLITQSNIALVGGALMTFAMAFYSEEDRVWQFKLMIIGVATFLVGVTWMMHRGENSQYLSFPSVLCFISAAMGLAVFFAPNRLLQPS
jgi:hypothetical protein